MNYIFGDRKNINLIACLILFFATSSLVCSDQGIPLEEAIERNGYEADKEWYRVVVRQWNDVQENKYEPVY